MKKLTTKRGITYYWNGFWGFYVQPATKSGRERIYKEGSRMYEWLSKQVGWVED